MKKKLNTTQIISLVMSLLPIIVTAVFYSRLPDRIPTHWNLDGSVTYSGRGQIWMISAMSLVLGPLLVFLPRIDPRKRNYEKFQKYYDGVVIVFVVFMLAITGMVISESFKPGRLAISTIVCALVGLLFIFIGNIMPKIKSNFFMGIKTPWTLSSDVVWYRTHRIAGILWFIGGLLIIVSSFALNDVPLFVLLMAIVVVISVVPFVMSYVWYRKISRNSGDTGEKEQ
ncbi:MAG: SdpI family protein [Oscillospiraceae bacterium]|jgi:uncharacterized membrane protein